MGKQTEDIHFEVISAYVTTNKLIEDLPKTLILLGLYLYSLRYDQDKGRKFLKKGLLIKKNKLFAYL